MYEELIESNLNLVRSIAHKFRPLRSDVDDYIQVGVIGLIKSYQSFRGGSKFSVYAYKSIYWEISNFHKKEKKYKFNMLDKDLPSLRITHDMWDLFNEDEQELLHYNLLGYSVKDISATMNKSKSTIYRMLNSISKKIKNDPK